MAAPHLPQNRHARPFRVGMVVAAMGTGACRPDALWAPLSSAGNRRASSLPGRRETIATSGGTGTAIEINPTSRRCVGSVQVPGEPDAVLVLRALGLSP